LIPDPTEVHNRQTFHQKLTIKLVGVKQKKNCKNPFFGAVRLTATSVFGMKRKCFAPEYYLFSLQRSRLGEPSLSLPRYNLLVKTQNPAKAGRQSSG